MTKQASTKPLALSLAMILAVVLAVGPIGRLEAAGSPPASCTPALDEAWASWNAITAATDPWLELLTSEKLAQPYLVNGKPGPTTFGSLMLRMIYHYWYHIGENMAIRQMLGHKDLPEFVGNIDDEAPYLPESQ